MTETNPTPTAQASAERPGHIPEKFWDAQAGQVRVDALARSYGELERKLGAPERAAEAAPAHEAADYAIAIGHGMFDADPAINRRLREAGFSQAQAQLVYDLAAERLVPLVQDLAGEGEAGREHDRLVKHFGGEAKWRDVARHVAAWARANLPADAVAALSTTHDGVLAMHAMMSNREPGIFKGAGAPQALGEDELRRMIRDPRYWRERDPQWIAQVTEGYRRLYPGEAT